MAVPLPDSPSYLDPELASPPLATPLREPRLVSPSADENEYARSRSRTPESSHPAFDAEPHPSIEPSPRNKHESYDLSGSVFLITGDGKTLKLPVPSESSADPLNWGRWKTAGAMLALGSFSAFTLTVVQATSSMFHGLMQSFTEADSHPWTVETLITAPTLFMGIGAFFWIPLSLALGRRPVFLLASILVLLATIGAGFSRTFHQLLLFLSLLGFGEGHALSLAFLMVIDMTFISQRPMAIAGLWCFAGAIGVTSLSLVPFLSDHGNDWHTFYRWWSIPMTVQFVLVFLLYPETYFKRPTVAFDGLIVMQSATEKLTIYEDTEADSDIYRDLPDLPERKGFQRVRDRLGLSRSPFTSWKAMGRCYLQIAFCAVNPLIFWVLIASSFNFAGMMFIGATYGKVLAAPPYKLPSHLIIQVSNSSGLGSVLYFPMSWIVYKVLHHLSKRARGVREAEHYLVGYILPVTTGALSTLIYGFAVEQRWHYGFYYLAYGLNGFSWVSLSVSNTLWVTEAFPRWAAPALVVVGGGCYLLSFSMSFALVPWIAAHGYQLVGIELTVLQVVGGLIAVPIAFWGKNARQAINGRWANERAGALRPL